MTHDTPRKKPTADEPNPKKPSDVPDVHPDNVPSKPDIPDTMPQHGKKDTSRSGYNEKEPGNFPGDKKI